MRKEKAISSKSKDKKKKGALYIIICKNLYAIKHARIHTFYIYFKNNIMEYKI